MIAIVSPERERIWRGAWLNFIYATVTLLFRRKFPRRRISVNQSGILAVFFLN